MRKQKTRTKKEKRRFLKKASAFALSCTMVLSLVQLPGVSGMSKVEAATTYNYGTALQKSLIFYELQKSGYLDGEEFNRNNWRGDSCVNDGQDNGLDLTGGWFDAGDHVKFNLPMSYTATTLAWSYLENKEAYEKSGQTKYLKNEVKWACDYFIKCHVEENKYYYQVGDGNADHTYWGAAETVEARMERPSYWVDNTSENGGSAVCGETAAALAACAMVFAEDDPAYAATCLQHSKELLAMATEASSDKGYTAAEGFYHSWSGFYDELSWANLWLYKATGDRSYLTTAESYVSKFNKQGQSSDIEYQYGQSWDDVHYSACLLIAQEDGSSEVGKLAKQCIENNLDWWADGAKKKSPGGLSWLSEWGSVRYATTSAFLAMVYAQWDGGDSSKRETYKEWARTQAEYALGSSGQCFQVGYANATCPRNVHHRTAHGTWGDQLTAEPEVSRHLLVGALVGGCKAADDKYTDDRGDYYSNEVACDYNAGFTGLMAAMYAANNYTQPEAIDPNAGAYEEKDDIPELSIEASINAEDKTNTINFVEIKAVVYNKTAWPARVTDKLSYRFYVDISDAIQNGAKPEDFEVSTNYTMYDGTKISGLQPYDEAKGIYYTEIDLSGANLYPGGQNYYRNECQFRIKAPGKWDYSNSPSLQGLKTGNQDITLTEHIALYDDGVLVFGQEPDGTKPEDNPVETKKSPTVSITAPEADAVVDNTDGKTEVTVSADAAVEGSTITKVDFYAGSKLVGTAQKAPYSVSFIPEGTVSTEGESKTFSLTAKAYAENGKSTTSDAVVISVKLPVEQSSTEPEPEPNPEPEVVEVTAVKLNKETVSLEEGKTEKLLATVEPDNATDKIVTWTSDKTSVATVANGTVKAVAEGTAHITAKAGEKTAVCTVTVTKKEELPPNPDQDPVLPSEPENPDNPDPTPNPGDGEMKNGDDWLHTDGANIVDQNGTVVRLTGANWFGFNCGERVLHGLWSADIRETIKACADRGINILRIPISTELLMEWKNGEAEKAGNFSNSPDWTFNPDLVNEDGTAMNTLQVMDKLMEICKDYGVKVLIDCHSAKADNSGHVAPMWYSTDGSITTEDWIEGWKFIVDRYKNDDTFIAADLENEPHGKVDEDDYAKWDNSEDINNWKYAATKCAEEILKINPHMLILVEGIEMNPKEGYTYDDPVQKTNEGYINFEGAWWGGNLRLVGDNPIKFENNDAWTKQIMYSPHDYGPGVYNQTWFDKDFTEQTLLDDYWYDAWAYLVEEDISPLLMGEWGGFMDGAENEKWLNLLANYMNKKNISHTFWCLNPNSGDTGGLLDSSFMNWDEEKYALLEKTLWKDAKTNKYVSLDHANALGSNGESLSQYSGQSASNENPPEDDYVQATKITLDKTTADLLVDETVTLQATVLPSNATYKDVKWTSSDRNVATVKNGVVTAVGEGTATITAWSGSAENPVKVTCIVTVTEPENPEPEPGPEEPVAVTGIKLNTAATSVVKGESVTLTATVEPEDAADKTVVWSSNDETVATVKNGVVSGVKKGIAKITAKAGDKEAVCTITVMETPEDPDTVAVTGIKLNTTATSVEKGESVTLTATVEPENATDKTIVWSSNDETVATVKNGVVTGVKKGTAKITAKAGDKEAVCTITVTETPKDPDTIAVTGIKLNTTAESVEKGKSVTLTATVEPENATDKTVVWSSDDKTVATVKNGVVTGVKKGTAKITAKAGDKEAVCTITVTETPTNPEPIVIPVTGIRLDNENVTIVKGGSLKLSVTIEPEDATNQTVTWSSSNKTVATVSEDGKVTAVNEGTAEITAKAGDKTATCTITVEKAADPNPNPGPEVVSVTGVSIDNAKMELTAGEDATLKATVLPSDADNQNVSWESSDDSIVSVKDKGNGNAVITANKEGAAKITVITEDGGFKASCRVTVTKQIVKVTSVELDETALTLTVGGVRKLQATVLPAAAADKTVSFTSDNSNVASVDSDGRITARKVGTANITVTTTDGAKTATCKVTVKEEDNPNQVVRVTGVTIRVAKETIKAGETTTVTGTVAPADATNNQVDYISSDESVATVSANGIVKGIKAGIVTITAYARELDENGNDIKDSVTIKVEANEKAVENVTLSSTAEKIKVNEKITLKATVMPADATIKDVMWESSNPSVAEVSETGEVTALSGGYTYISVTTVDGNMTALCKVTVEVPVTSITISQKNAELVVGKTLKLTTKVEPEDATNQNVLWSSSKSAVASVDRYGKVTAVGVGTAEITVVTQDGEWKAVCKVSVIENQGSTEDSGNNGNIGDQGNSGNQGNTGEQGNTGDQGNTEDQGNAGNQTNQGNNSQPDSGNQSNTGNQTPAEEQAIEEAKKGTVSLAESEAVLNQTNTDKKDPADSTFATLRLKAEGKKKAVKLSWTKVSDAAGYLIYGAACGQKMKLITTVDGSKKNYTAKSLKAGKYYKYVVKAYKEVAGEKRVLATSKSVHAVTDGGKYGNPTKVTIKSATIKMKAGKMTTLQPKLTAKKTVKIHIAKFRYESDNKEIATVNSKGKVKAVKKGSCNIYIYAQNGVYKKVKVKVN